MSAGFSRDRAVRLAAEEHHAAQIDADRYPELARAVAEAAGRARSGAGIEDVHDAAADRVPMPRGPVTDAQLAAIARAVRAAQARDAADDTELPAGRHHSTGTGTAAMADHEAGWAR